MDSNNAETLGAPREASGNMNAASAHRPRSVANDTSLRDGTTWRQAMLHDRDRLQIAATMSELANPAVNWITQG